MFLLYDTENIIVDCIYKFVKLRVYKHFNIAW